MELNTDILGLPVAVRVPEPDHLVIDCSMPGDKPNTSTGPRFWLERAKNADGLAGWKLIIHPGNGEPSHCAFIADSDEESSTHIYADNDPAWPVTDGEGQ